MSRGRPLQTRSLNAANPPTPDREQLTLDEEAETFGEFVERTRREYLEGRDLGDETEEETPSP